MAGTDVLVVSGQGTGGWPVSAAELVASLERVGASVASARATRPPRVRTFALTDLVQATAARRASARAITAHDPHAVIYCSVTAALLWPRPGAIWLDSTAGENRPGRHGVWQRAVERRRLRDAPLLLAMSASSLAGFEGPHAEVVVVATPVERSGPLPARRDIAALTYAGDPEKKRLDLILDSWSRARHTDETLIVTGTDSGDLIDGVQFVGRLPRPEYRALLRRSRLFIAASRREDYGIAQLESLVDGCLLVTTPAPGAYPALELARKLDPRTVGSYLPRAIRIALDDPLPDYAERAAKLLAPFSRAAVDRTLAERVLPRLVPAQPRA